MRGALAAAFGLAVLQVLVSTPRAYGGVGSILGGAARAVEAFLSPDVPGIPDRRQPATALPSTATAPAVDPAPPAPPTQTALVPPPATASTNGRNPI